MLPTIDEWMVQWKFAIDPFIVSELLAPGARSPKSADPSSSTTWCIVVSLFLKTSVFPAVTITGLGENALLPAEPTMLTVTVVATGGVAVGAVGVAAGALEPPPQLHIATAAANATLLGNENRMVPPG
jgi:hypothetical protein